MYSFRAEPLERGAQQLRQAEGKLEEKETTSIHQDTLHAGDRAGSFESPYKIDCTLTTPELMLSGGLFNGVTTKNHGSFVPAQ